MIFTKWNQSLLKVMPAQFKMVRLDGEFIPNNQLCILVERVKNKPKSQLTSSRANTTFLAILKKPFYYCIDGNPQVQKIKIIYSCNDRDPKTNAIQKDFGMA